MEKEQRAQERPVKTKPRTKRKSVFNFLLFDLTFDFISNEAKQSSEKEKKRKAVVEYLDVQLEKAKKKKKKKVSISRSRRIIAFGWKR